MHYLTLIPARHHPPACSCSSMIGNSPCIAQQCHRHLHEPMILSKSLQEISCMPACSHLSTQSCSGQSVRAFMHALTQCSFLQVASKVHARLQSMGARALLPCQLADEDGLPFSEQAHQWGNQLLDRLQQKHSGSVQAQADATDKGGSEVQMQVSGQASAQVS